MRSSIASPAGLTISLGLAATLCAADARAQSTLTLLRRMQVSDSPPAPTDAVGDIEPGVVAKDLTEVLVSWVHIPGMLHVDPMSVVQARGIPLTGTPTGVANGGVGFPVVLALTADSTGPIQIVGGPDTTNATSARWHIYAARPGSMASLAIVPTPAQPGGFDQGVGIREISVPRRIRGTASMENLPIGMLVDIQSVPSLMTIGVGIDSSLMAFGGSSSPAVPTNGGNGTARAAYWFDGSGGVLEQFVARRAAFDTSGNLLGGSEALANPPRTRPAFTNAQSGALRAIVASAGGGLECRTYSPSGSPTVVDCGTPAATVVDLDAVADEQYADDVWFTGSTAADVPDSYLFVGETHSPGPLFQLDTEGVSNCFHPRIAAMLGEPVTAPQHAVVVASCLPTGDPAPRVFAWIVERPAVPVDAGVDASADASDDASADAADDVTASQDAGVDGAPIDDGSVAVDSGSSSISFRGSGCSCSVPGSDHGDSRRGSAVSALFALLAFAATKRRRAVRSCPADC